MIRITAVVAALAIGATAVYAQNLDAIKKRRDVMKAIATAGTVNFNMMKGDIPFDLAKVQAGLKTYQDEAAKLLCAVPGRLQDRRRHRRIPENLAGESRVRCRDQHVHRHGEDRSRHHHGRGELQKGIPGGVPQLRRLSQG